MSRWYIIHAYSGFENKVKEQILADAGRMGLEALVDAVEVPVETVTEVRRGKKVQAERKFFPGYVLAKLNMNDDVYHLVKNQPKVTGFLGSSGGRTHPQHQGSRRRRAQGADQRRLRDRRFGEGARRPIRELQRPGRRDRFRQGQGQGERFDFWPRDACGTGFRASRAGQVNSAQRYFPRERSTGGGARSDPFHVTGFTPVTAPLTQRPCHSRRAVLPLA